MNSRRKKGFTLTEAVVSFFILFVVGIAIFGLFSYTTQVEKKDQALTEANHLAVSLLETIDSEVKNTQDYQKLDTTDYNFLHNSQSFVYKVDVEEVNSAMKYLGVSIFHRNSDSVDPLPDFSRPENGRVIRMGTFISRP